MNKHPLFPLFDPRSVAVFGASESADSVGGRVFSNILQDGFQGQVYPINPKHKQVAGRTSAARIGDIDAEIDLAVIATPARTVPGILRDCAEHGIRNAIVLSAGFGEAGGEGKGLGDEITDIARRAKLRFLGPNCVGLIRPGVGLNATFLRTGAPKGHLALVSQSGALCSAITDWAGPNHLGFSAVVSLGNAADVGFGDTFEFLAQDPQTRAILAYVEGVRDASAFISALRLAARTKPVIVLKAGRNDQSAKAAQTHTGALIGSDAVFDAALARAGAVRANTFGQLFAAAEILAADKRARGNRLGIVTNGGGAGVLAADRAGELGLDLAAPSDATLKALDQRLAVHWSRSNPVDILGDAAPDDYAVAVTAAMDDTNFDGVLVMLTPQAMTDPIGAAEAVIASLPKRPKKPLLACWMGQSSVAEARNLLSSSGIPDFTTPERAVEAFSYLAQHARNRQLALEVPGPLPFRAQPDLTGVQLIIDAALSDGRDLLSDVESKAVLRSFGIPVNITIEAASAEDALVAAQTVGFPVAMKINSPQVTHKSDVGGVRTGIATAAEVKLAFREMLAGVRAARPEAEIEGVTVEPMAAAESARELLVGVSRDPVFGAALTFGAGGTMVEILRDNAVTLPPLTEVLANRMIDATRVARLLDAFRDRPAVDRKAVVDVLLRIADLVCEFPQITELDINPLFAGPKGVIAVDARIAVARPPAKDGPYDHVAIHPYPRRLVRHDHLSDGTELTIRPIRPEDAEGEQSFVQNLSPEAKRFRFMGTMKQLSPEMLVQFTQVDYRREMALIAVTTGKDGPVQQGVARYVINPDKTSCEFAIVVADAIQGQGIGTRLMKALMDAARDHGLEVIEGTVLTENTGMLKLTAGLGFRQTPDPEDREIMRVERAL